MSIVAIHISRGLAAVQAIGPMAAAATWHGCHYVDPICGVHLLDAKNQAVAIAMQYEADLLLMEDDIIADNAVWERTMQADGLTYARCRSRDGRDNVYIDNQGAFDYTGTVFTKIPLAVLRCMEQPIFEAKRFRRLGEHKGIVPVGPPKGVHQWSGSDVYFWWKVRQITPCPRLIETGRVVHLKTPLNAAKCHNNPIEVATW